MLNLFEVSELKNLLKEKNAGILHLHDTCGGQYFTIEDRTDLTNEILTEFLNSKGQKIQFSSDFNSFTLK